MQMALPKFTLYWLKAQIIIKDISRTIDRCAV